MCSSKATVLTSFDKVKSWLQLRGCNHSCSHSAVFSGKQQQAHSHHLYKTVSAKCGAGSQSRPHTTCKLTVQSMIQKQEHAVRHSFFGLFGNQAHRLRLGLLAVSDVQLILLKLKLNFPGLFDVCEKNNNKLIPLGQELTVSTHGSAEGEEYCHARGLDCSVEGCQFDL